MGGNTRAHTYTCETHILSFRKLCFDAHPTNWWFDELMMVTYVIYCSCKSWVNISKQISSKLCRLALWTLGLVVEQKRQISKTV